MRLQSVLFNGVLLTYLSFSTMHAQLPLNVVAQNHATIALPAPVLNQSDRYFKDATQQLFSGESEQATLLLKKAAQGFLVEKRYREWTGCYAGLAITLTNLERYDEFIRISKKALRIHYRLNNQDRESEETLKTNLGMAYYMVGKKKKAEAYMPSLKPTSKQQ